MLAKRAPGPGTNSHNYQKQGWIVIAKIWLDQSQEHFCNKKWGKESINHSHGIYIDDGIKGAG
jgi:hypothetical protein